MAKRGRKQNQRIIRWLGAFRKGAENLHSALSFELSPDRPQNEVAAEDTFKSRLPVVGIGSQVGLLVETSAVTRSFSGDCWSELNAKTGRLYPTRKAAKTEHSEVFCLPKYAGIVIAGEAKKQTLKTCLFFARKHGLPLFRVEIREDSWGDVASWGFVRLA